MESIVFFILFHINVLFYAVTNYYFHATDKELFKQVHLLFIDKNILKKLIKKIIKTTIIYEALVRCYLMEILKIVSLNNYLWVPIAVSIYYQQYRYYNIQIQIAYIIHSTILCYFYLQEYSIIGSVLLHVYDNLLIITILVILHNKLKKEIMKNK
jgi:hypothetical protein